jgi:hypothetical protein
VLSSAYTSPSLFSCAVRQFGLYLPRFRMEFSPELSAPNGRILYKRLDLPPLHEGPT